MAGFNLNAGLNDRSAQLSSLQYVVHRAANIFSCWLYVILCILEYISMQNNKAAVMILTHLIENYLGLYNVFC